MNVLSTELSRHDVWHGEHLNISFEIVHWGVERGSFPPVNNGKGIWNYYIFIQECKITNFNDFYLTPTLYPNHFIYRYSNSPLANLPWHGGLTYWDTREADVPGFRTLKLGCDYCHAFDDYNEITLEKVLFECKLTIDKLVSFLQFKPTKQ